MLLLAQNGDTLKKIRLALVEWLPDCLLSHSAWLGTKSMIKCAKIEGKIKVKILCPHFSHKMWEDQNKLLIKTF